MEINYKKKYFKYKQKYQVLKKTFQYGGHNFIHDMVDKMIEDGETKTKILPKILSEIMKKLKINIMDYAIIASYCLHKYRNITDLDVIVDATAYPLLKNSGIFEVSTAKISRDERLVLKLPKIDPNAEIEIFPKERNEGFPSEKFSLNNLHLEDLLLYDEYGNPYYNEITCILQYSDISYKNNKYFVGEHEISLDRVMKNISQLEFIKNNTKNIQTKMFCDEKILNLKYMIEKI